MPSISFLKESDCYTTVSLHKSERNFIWASLKKRRNKNEFYSVLDNLKIYEAGKPIELVVREFGIDVKDIIKLASNENPRGCSPRVIEALKDEAKKANLYPDDSMYELKEGLANKFKVKNENIIVGAGSDQVINFALQAKANENRSILMAKTTFAMYEIYGRQTGTKILKLSHILTI